MPQQQDRKMADAMPKPRGLALGYGRSLGLWMLALSCGGMSACVKKPQAQDTTPPLPAHPASSEPVAAKKSSVGVINISVDLASDGLHLHVSNVPEGSTLECHIDEKSLDPCKDGGVYARPTPGDHRVTAISMHGNVISALGESKSFTVTPEVAGTIEQGSGAKDPLALQVDDATFANGMTYSINKDFVAKFRLQGQAPCAQPVLHCKYDMRTSAFWTACDSGNGSFTVSKEVQAIGLQYLSVQASCGDQMGPELVYFWYGVPDDYQPMMLRDIQDSNHRHILNLVKDDDCPIGDQKFECAPQAQDQFAVCSNVVDSPAAGYRVRMMCGDKSGPVLTLVP